MIRINHPGNLPFYQNDTLYNLPSVTGTVQWNGMSKKFQVSTGTSWMDIDNSVSLSPNHDFMNIINWAQEKMHEEKELERLAKENSTLKDLVDQINYTKEQIKVVTTLLKA
jgi:hypothetical protein